MKDTTSNREREKMAWPSRRLLGLEEKAAADALFDQSIAAGEAFGYSGPSDEAFCSEFAEFMGGGYADAVNSGTSAVFVALKALGIEPFTEVVVSPITDPGGFMPIVMLNCIPIVMDTAPGRFNVGPEQVEAAITPLTSAILVTHILGEPADMEGIMAVARKHNLPVLEDCAQSHGARINGKMVGTFGDIAAFSTMSGKHFCSGGQGGVVFTKNEALYHEARRASDRGKPFFMPPGSTNCVASLNLNSDDLACEIGRVQLRKLPAIITGRRRAAAAIFAGLGQIRAISKPEEPANSEGSYWRMRFRFNPVAVSCDKQTFCNALEDAGIPIQADYNCMPHTQEWFVKRRVFGTSGYPWASADYKGDRDRKFECPNAVKAIADHFIVFTHENMTDEDVRDFLEIISETESKYRK